MLPRLASRAKYGSDAKVLIVRETYKGLQMVEDTMVDLLMQAFPGQVKFNRQEHIARIAGGGTIEFGQIADHRDVSKYQGRECTMLCIDEAGLLREWRYVTLLKSNMRSPADVPLSTVLTGNPGGHQHQYIHKTFISSGLPWHPRTIDGEVWCVAVSTMTDNPHINTEDYTRKITAACGHDVDLARAWISGDWNINRGAFFAGDLDEKIHMLPAALPFQIQRHWAPRISIDWGLSAPAVVLFHALSPGDVGGMPAGSVVVFDEISTHDPNDLSRGLGWPPGKLAEAILEVSGKYNIHPSGVIDDAMGLQGSGDTLINLFMTDHRIYLQKPEKGRASGWAKIKNLLHNAKERNGKPGLYISERCGYLWQTMPFVPRDPRRPEDLDTNSNDHGADALRYAVASPYPFIRQRDIHGYEARH